MAKVQFEFSLPARISRQDGYFVGCFPHLDVVSQGRSIEEARANLIEAAQLFIESCYARNVLDEVMKSCGFQPAQEGEQDALPDMEQLVVPFELLARRGAAITC
jgi:predicted RNase H-like HicB family nuclease